MGKALLIQTFNERKVNEVKHQQMVQQLSLLLKEFMGMTIIKVSC
jgi:hypothetical protein